VFTRRRHDGAADFTAFGPSQRGVASGPGTCIYRVSRKKKPHSLSQKKTLIFCKKSRYPCRFAAFFAKLVSLLSTRFKKWGFFFWDTSSGVFFYVTPCTRHVVGRSNGTISPLRFSESRVTQGGVFLGGMFLFSPLFLQLSVV